MRPWLLLPIALTVGCSDPAQPGNASDLSGSVLVDLSRSSPADLSQTKGDMAQQYPAGPYGNHVGDTFPPLVWEGYSDPTADAIATSKPYGPYTMDDLRRSGSRYAAIHASAFT